MRWISFIDLYICELSSLSDIGILGHLSQLGFLLGPDRLRKKSLLATPLRILEVLAHMVTVSP